MTEKKELPDLCSNGGKDMYIIIGASSFIGVYTVDEFLEQGCEVIVTGRNNKFREH